MIPSFGFDLGGFAILGLDGAGRVRSWMVLPDQDAVDGELEIVRRVTPKAVLSRWTFRVVRAIATIDVHGPDVRSDGQFDGASLPRGAR